MRTEILSRILSADKPGYEEDEAGERTVIRPWFTYQWLAAACVALLLVAGSIYILRKNDSSGSEPAVASVESGSGAARDFVRNLTLPDGSSVVLQAGSTLNYPARFKNGTREVWLSGEAYFDVKRTSVNPGSSPFVIHSGKLTTTVLGTSFNIKAYPGDSEIVVSVTKGKVRVENDKEILGVLTPDDELTYSIESSKSTLLHADVAQSIDWVKNDVTFDGVAFGKIAEIVEKRFGVHIRFKNDLLKSCVIVSSFDGTETIQNVLETLCSISNSSYKMLDDKEILIDGVGCQGTNPSDIKSHNP
jgi:transmembrane sensor